MVDTTIEKLLEKATQDFPIGTKFIFCYGTEDVTKYAPYICEDRKRISVNCKKARGRLIYDRGKWVEIIYFFVDSLKTIEIW